MKDHFYYSGSVHYKMIRLFVLTTEPLYSIMEMKWVRCFNISNLENF